MPTKIEWATDTWNPITGCTPISEGCQNCYAKRMSKRLAGRCGYSEDDPFAVTLHPDKLDQPLRWKKPRMIFVCSMGDLFHPDVKDEWLDEIFGMIMAFRVLANMPSHTFIILTKRPGRMRQYFTAREPVELIKSWASAAPVYTDNPDITFEDAVYSAVCRDWDKYGRNSSGSEYKPWGYPEQLFPLPNLWLGVTAENQQRAEERIPTLLEIPAAKRFVSVEPMLGPVNLEFNISLVHPDNEGYGIEAIKGLDWIICGGETGPGARPMHPDWVRGLRDQCQAAGVPFFFKSWGDWAPGTWMADSESDMTITVNNDLYYDLEKMFDSYSEDKRDNWAQKNFYTLSSTGIWCDPLTCYRGECMVRVGKKYAGRQLDGQTWEQRP